MNKEQENKSSEVARLIGDYVEHKNALADLILNELEDGVEHSIKKIKEHELHVERAFKALISNRPQSITDCLRKLEFFAEQISNESEVSNYHKEALKCIVADFKRLDGRILE